MGAPFGVPVFVSPSWFLVAALITVFFAPTFAAQVPGIGPGRYAVSFAFAVLLYLSVLVHELSHSVVAKSFGLPVRRITLHLLGGVSEIEREAETPWQEFAVAVAGPLLSAACAALGFALTLVLPQSTVLSVLAFQLMTANIIVTVFNLIPGLPLDGGRVLSALVWKLTGRRLSGIKVAGWVGRVLAVLVFAAPFVLARLDGTGPDIVLVVWFALIASFVWVGAGQAITQARLRARLPGAAVSRLVRPVVRVAAGLPLSEALRQAAAANPPGGARAGILVVTGDGTPSGLVNAAAVAATPPERRPWVSAAEVARSLDPAAVLTAHLTGEEVVAAIQARPAGEYLVVGDSGEVLGVVLTSDVEAALTASA